MKEEAVPIETENNSSENVGNNDKSEVAGVKEEAEPIAAQNNLSEDHRYNLHQSTQPAVTDSNSPSTGDTLEESQHPSKDITSGFLPYYRSSMKRFLAISNPEIEFVDDESVEMMQMFVNYFFAAVRSSCR